jgi:hypothetical protein
MVQPDRKTMVIEHVSSQSRPVAVLPDDEDVLSPLTPYFCVWDGMELWGAEGLVSGQIGAACEVVAC